VCECECECAHVRTCVRVRLHACVRLRRCAFLLCVCCVCVCCLRASALTLRVVSFGAASTPASDVSPFPLMSSSTSDAGRPATGDCSLFESSLSVCSLRSPAISRPREAIWLCCRVSSLKSRSRPSPSTFVRALDPSLLDVVVGMQCQFQMGKHACVQRQ
jgi:hypothetical protein